MHDDQIPMPNNAPRSLDEAGFDDSEDSLGEDSLAAGDEWDEGEDASDDGFAAGDSWGEDLAEDDGFEADLADDALDSEGDLDEFAEDGFLGFRAAMNRVGRAVRTVAARTAPQFGELAGQALRGVVQEILQPSGFDGLDAFAEVAVASRMAADDLDAFAPALAQAGAQRALAAVVPARRRPQAIPGLRPLAQELRQAIHAVVRVLIRRDPRALRALSQILRRAIAQVRQLGNPRALPQTIRQIARRVVTNPQARRTLISPRPAVQAALRRVNPANPAAPTIARGGLARGARIVAAGARREGRTIILQGPVRIILGAG